jgi:hypothetical protein
MTACGLLRPGVTTVVDGPPAGILACTTPLPPTHTFTSNFVPLFGAISTIDDTDIPVAVDQTKLISPPVKVDGTIADEKVAVNFTGLDAAGSL